MTQVLLRAVSLRHRKEYELALREVDQALRGLENGAGAGEVTDGLEDWIALCQGHEAVATGLMPAVARLHRERGELLALRAREDESHRSRRLALGLLVEAILSGRTFVSGDLLDDIEALWLQTGAVRRGSALLRRMVAYFEARGQFARAEDALFEWVESGDPEAVAAGQLFYDRLMATHDVDLERGNLPRAEIAAGRAELLRGGARGASAGRESRGGPPAH